MPRPSFARWFGIALRGAHLVSVIFLGAALLAGNDKVMAAVVAVLVSGGILFALDTWVFPGHIYEISGASVIVKLLLVAAMAIDESLRLPMFWVVVFWSVLFSHAPATLRHHRWRRPAGPQPPPRGPGDRR